MVLIYCLSLALTYFVIMSTLLTLLKVLKVIPTTIKNVKVFQQKKMRYLNLLLSLNIYENIKTSDS